jgi:hypothetical protein
MTLFYRTESANQKTHKLIRHIQETIVDLLEHPKPLALSARVNDRATFGGYCGSRPHCMIMRKLLEVIRSLPMKPSIPQSIPDSAQRAVSSVVPGGGSVAPENEITSSVSSACSSSSNLQANAPVATQYLEGFDVEETVQLRPRHYRKSVQDLIRSGRLLLLQKDTYEIVPADNIEVILNNLIESTTLESSYIVAAPMPEILVEKRKSDDLKVWAELEQLYLSLMPPPSTAEKPTGSKFTALRVSFAQAIMENMCPTLEKLYPLQSHPSHSMPRYQHIPPVYPFLSVDDLFDRITRAVIAKGLAMRGSTHTIYRYFAFLPINLVLCIWRTWNCRSKSCTFSGSLARDFPLPICTL